MKKILNTIFILGGMSTILYGCGEATEVTIPETSSVEVVMLEDLIREEKTDNSLPISKDGIDVDLTILNNTMAYSELYYMMMSPDEYMGKSVKIRGDFATSYMEDTDLTYFFVLITDYTACCQQGIEFLMQGDAKYPEDYPEEGTPIEIIGIFSSYEELGYTYYCLKTEEINIVEE